MLGHSTLGFRLEAANVAPAPGEMPPKNVSHTQKGQISGSYNFILKVQVQDIPLAPLAPYTHGMCCVCVALLRLEWGLHWHFSPCPCFCSCCCSCTVCPVPCRWQWRYAPSLKYNFLCQVQAVSPKTWHTKGQGAWSGRNATRTAHDISACLLGCLCSCICWPDTRQDCGYSHTAL